VYSTEQNTKAENSFNKAQKKLLENDPLDIADTAPGVFKREQKQVLNQINRAGIANPQWINNTTLYFSAFSTEESGSYNRVSDVFSYNTETGNIEQLTELAGIRRFSVTSDGETLYAEQVRGGYISLLISIFKRKLAIIYTKYGW